MMRATISVMSPRPDGQRLADDWAAARAEARRPDADPAALIAILSASTDDEAREAAAANPNCPSGILSIFVAEPGALVCVRRGAARNPACPPSTAEYLAKDPDPTVREAVAHNPAAPTTTRAQAGLTAD